MQELKTVKCTGDVISGDIFENVDQDGNVKTNFRIDEMVGDLVTGGRTQKKVRLRYSVETLKELRDEIDTVIERMNNLS
jgi:hypothetical protein